MLLLRLIHQIKKHLINLKLLRFFTDWGKAHINNVLFENNFFTDLQRFGVHIKHSNANGLDNRHTDFVFRNNEFKEIGHIFCPLSF